MRTTGLSEPTISDALTVLFPAGYGAEFQTAHRFDDHLLARMQRQFAGIKVIDLSRFLKADAHDLGRLLPRFSGGYRSRFLPRFLGGRRVRLLPPCPFYFFRFSFRIYFLSFTRLSKRRQPCAELCGCQPSVGVGGKICAGVGKRVERKAQRTPCAGGAVCLRRSRLQHQWRRAAGVRVQHVQYAQLRKGQKRVEAVALCRKRQQLRRKAECAVFSNSSVQKSVAARSASCDAGVRKASARPMLPCA